jgi:ribosomal protein L22
MEALSRQKFVRVTPRKMRIVADLVRGKNCNQALSILRFVPRAASPLILKASSIPTPSRSQRSGWMKAPLGKECDPGPGEGPTVV